MVRTSDLKVQNIFSVKDYVCLVTGGGTGIGLMATQALAANGTVAPTSLFSAQTLISDRCKGLYHWSSYGGLGECSQIP